MCKPESAPDCDEALGDYFASLIAEFFEIPETEAKSNLREEFHNPGGLVARSWQKADPKTTLDVARFYQETDSYVYDLAADHSRARRLTVRDAIIKRIERRGPDQNVLLYGDGIGTDSIAIARRSHRATYFDLPGRTSAFARFRFEKEKLSRQIAALSREEDIPSGDFDVVVCIEVLEHVTDPVGVMRTIHRALKPGGITLITESFESIGPDYPSHLPENFKYAGRTHQMMEGLGFANTYYNTDPVNRPMEFTKIERDLAGEFLKLKGKVRRAINSRLPRH